MRIVDAQVHVWGADTPERPWPRGGNPKPHREIPWTAAELVAGMDAAGIGAAVIVPPGWEGERNDLALAAVAQYPGRFAVMGRFDPLLHDPFDAFQRWRDQPGMLGVRFTFHSARGGALLLEHGHDQGSAVQGLLRAAGFAGVSTRPDLAGLARCTGGCRTA